VSLLGTDPFLTIRSLKSVNDIPFGADRSALSGLGSPLRDTRNQRGEAELAFAEGIYRFAAGKLVEVSFRLPSIIEVNEHRVAGGSLVEFLKQHDPKFREVYGFAVAPTLGLAVDVEHDDHWTTAFVAGRWDHLK
jgi:hypothetical protein